MAKRRGKAPKGREESLNHSTSRKVIKKRYKKSSRKTDGTSNSKVAHSTSKQELVSVPTYVSATTLIPPDNDQKKHIGTSENKHVAGFIFMCNKNTKAECYEYRVFGLPKGKIEVVKNIGPDTKLFLFDTNSKLLYGIYQATSKGALDLEPTAFNGQFQAQVKFKIFKDCLPLPESGFKHAIKDNYEGHRKFKQELSSTQVKSIISLFHPIAKKKSSAQKSRIRPNVAREPSFRSTRTKEVVKSYPLENLSSGVHYHPILETRPQHDVHHGQYDPLEPGLHVSHSQVQPRLVRVEVPPRHVEAYRPDHAHEAYFPEKSFRYPPDSYESIRTTMEKNNHGDDRFVYGRQYHASQLLSDRDATRIDHTPGYYSHGLSATASLTAPFSQVRSSAYHPQNRMPSPYRPENRLPSPYRLENRLPSPYRLENRLPSSYRPENRLPSPHHSYYTEVAAHDQGRFYAGLPQGPASGNLSYGESKLPNSYYYSSAATRLSYR